MIQSDITKEEIEKGYRITKLNYVWENMSQKIIKKVFQYANINNFHNALRKYMILKMYLHHLLMMLNISLIA